VTRGGNKFVEFSGKNVGFYALLLCKLNLWPETGTGGA